jgi:ADP-L-glycero-D-manno-heptose 6-epimerase
MAENTKHQMPFLIVTGAAGFIGSRLARKLYERHKQTKTILLVDDLEFFSTRACCEIFRSYQGLKFLSPSDLLTQMERGQIPAAAVFHMGACSSTTEMREAYLRENNTEYSKRIWKICSEQKIPLYYASSAATYGAGEQGYNDSHEVIPSLKPLNPYGWSKQNFDLFVCEELNTQRPTPPHWAGFKFFNVYGPGEDHKGSQATAMLHAFKQFTQTGRMKLFRSHKEGIADGEQKRDFVFVDDVCEVMMSFYKNKYRDGIYNLGTGKARTFLDLVKASAAALDVPCEIEWIDTPEHLRAHYQYFTEANLTRLRQAGYNKPFIEVEEGAQVFCQEWKKGRRL